MKKTFLALTLAWLAFVTFNVFADDNTTRIFFWHIKNTAESDNLWLQAAQEFMAGHPRVKIALSVFDREEYFLRLRQAMKSGNPPDVFACYGGDYETVYYADQGLLKNITQEIRDTVWGKTFSRAALEMYARQNRYFGVPVSMGMIGLWYNKALFREHGLQPFATWSELLAGVKKLKAAGIVPIALGGVDKWPGYFWWKYLALRLGGRQALRDVVAGKISFESTPFIRAGELLKELAALEPFPDNFLGLGYTEQERALAHGRAAMELMGQWSVGVQAFEMEGESWEDNLGFMPFPTVEGGVGSGDEAFGGGEGLALGVNAPPEAVEFLKFVTGDKMYARLAAQPEFVSVVRGAEGRMRDPALRLVAKTVAAVGRMHYYFDATLPVGVSQAMFDAVHGIYAGTMTPPVAMAAIRRAYDGAQTMDEVMRQTTARRADEAESEPVAADHQTPAVEKREDASGRVRIGFWHTDTNDIRRGVWQNLADGFMREHPGILIDIEAMEYEAFKQKLSVAMVSGNPPDVFRIWTNETFRFNAEKGLLRDLTDDIAGTAWGRTLSPGALDAFTVRGRLYGIPYAMGMAGLWYNKAIFKKHDLQEFKTWSDLVAGVKKLKKAGVVPVALGERDQWPGLFWWSYLALRLGGRKALERAIDGAGSFRDKAFVEAGKRIRELVDLGAFQNDFLTQNYGGDQARLFATGGAAMELMGQWAPLLHSNFSETKEGLGPDLGFMPFPMLEGGAGDPDDALGTGDGLALSRNAPPEALEFLKYVTRQDVYRQLAEADIAYVTTVRGTSLFMINEQQRRISELVELAPSFQIYYSQYLPPGMNQALLDATFGLFSGKLTPEKTANMIQNAWEKERK